LIRQPLRDHRAVTHALVAKHGGRIVKTTGDDVLLGERRAYGRLLALSGNTAARLNCRYPATCAINWVTVGQVWSAESKLRGSGQNGDQEAASNKDVVL
jgi:hypothetical protein